MSKLLKSSETASATSVDRLLDDIRAGRERLRKRVAAEADQTRGYGPSKEPLDGDAA